tara:strand:- start:56 stop:1648 length:1593 start_codon:yes stop_codon:yes gene_type:complete
MLLIDLYYLTKLITKKMIIEIKKNGDLKYIKNQDIIIIGAGTIGLYLASRLNEENSNLKIVLVEYGDEKASSLDNQYLSDSMGEKHLGTLDGRAYGIGGTSTLWGGQLAEFEKADFKDWPLDYSEIKKYYSKVYPKLNLDGVLDDGQYRNILNTNIRDDLGIEHIYTRWLKEPNFYKFFKKTILKKKNIKLIKNTIVNDIYFNKDKASSVKCVSKNSFEYHLDGRKFIFANGTLGINQFFLSTAELSAVPWKKNLNIGSYFQDHLATKIGTLSLQNEDLFRECYENIWINGVKIQPKLKFSESERVNKKNGVVLFFSYKSRYEDSMRRIKNIANNINKIFKLKTLVTFFKDIYIIRRSLFLTIFKLIYKKRVHSIFETEDSIEINIQSEQIPIRHSRIIIDRNKRLENGLFKTRTDWAFTGEETTAIKDLSINVGKFLEINGIGKIKFNQNFYNNDRFKSGFYDTNHQCGGLRMSKNKEYGVVDKNCKVWDTSNVWVAGAAVFPSSSHANSTFTALALCERILEESILEK